MLSLSVEGGLRVCRTRSPLFPKRERGDLVPVETKLCFQVSVWQGFGKDRLRPWRPLHRGLYSYLAAIVALAPFGQHGFHLCANAAQVVVLRLVFAHPLHGPVEPHPRLVAVT